MFSFRVQWYVLYEVAGVTFLGCGRRGVMSCSYRRFGAAYGPVFRVAASRNLLQTLETSLACWMSHWGEKESSLYQISCHWGCPLNVEGSSPAAMCLCDQCNSEASCPLRGEWKGGETFTVVGPGTYLFELTSQPTSCTAIVWTLTTCLVAVSDVVQAALGWRAQCKLFQVARFAGV